MSKKKNTLKDLDEFLKQQAATLVSPQKLTDTPKEEAVPEPIRPKEIPVVETQSPAQMLEKLKAMSSTEGAAFRKNFYELIISTLESQKDLTPEDTILINTALYLRNPSNWKEAIRSYWKNKK